MTLAPSLRQRLARAKLLAPHVSAVSGIGERPSRDRGEGIEFEEHRAFRTGDDARRIDPHVYARTGVAHVREFNVGRQLTVTLLIDLSRSMGFGDPPKAAAARVVASGLAFVGLAGADAIQANVWCDGRLHRHQRCSGLGRHGELERWWSRFEPVGSSDLVLAVRNLRADLPRHGLAVAVSDFWSDGALDALDALAAAGQSVIAIQLLASEEVHPERMARGSVRLLDAEGGTDVDVEIDEPTIDRYRAALGAWTDAVRSRVTASAGRFARVVNDDDVDGVFLRTLPAAGVLR